MQGPDLGPYLGKGDDENQIKFGKVSLFFNIIIPHKREKGVSNVSI